MRDDDGGGRPGLQGTASAFQSGWNAAGDKGKKPKEKKDKKGKKDKSDGSVTMNPLLGTGLSTSALNYGGSRKKGGPIKKTALYKLHKGEFVVRAKHRSSGRKASRKKTITKH